MGSSLRASSSFFAITRSMVFVGSNPRKYGSSVWRTIANSSEEMSFGIFAAESRSEGWPAWREGRVVMGRLWR